MKIISLVLIISSLTAISCQRENKPLMKPAGKALHSVASELRIFYDVSSLPVFLDGTLNAQVSSYDTTGGNDDGFSGRFSFLRKKKDGSLILFDVSGGGVINRIWTPTPTEDTLDFFIDDTLRPSFSIFYPDLFSGKVFPFIAPLCGNQLGGYYCYLPMPFEKSFRIISRGKKEQFHQIQYRMYEKDAVVRSFSMNPDPEIRESLEKIRLLWNRESKTVADFYAAPLSVSSGDFELRSGTGTNIFEKEGGGRILGMELSPADAFEGPEKNIFIKISWDGEKLPAVFCPAGDFFGYAFGAQSMQSLLLGSQDNKVYCYIPMPFDRSARIELIRGKTGVMPRDPVRVKAQIWYSSDKRDALHEGKFYSHWENMPALKTGIPHVFADIKGRGHYIGTILQAQGLKAGMTIFFEGDDSTAIDGTSRLHGTGSEDYFNGGWYAMMDRWDDKMSLPLHGSLGYSLPFCRTGGYRFYLTDKLSFEKSLFHSIEHGPAGNMVPAAYTSLGFYFCDTPVEKITDPSQVPSRVFIPDTLFIYPQLMAFTQFGNMDIKTTWKYGTGGESYLFTPGENSWLRISLKEIPKGFYSVYLDVIREPAGCEFSLWQRQKQVSGWIPTYNDREERIEDLYICDIPVAENCETVTLRFRPGKYRNSLLLNRMKLIRK